MRPTNKVKRCLSQDASPAREPDDEVPSTEPIGAVRANAARTLEHLGLTAALPRRHRERRKKEASGSADSGQRTFAQSQRLSVSQAARHAPHVRVELTGPKPGLAFPRSNNISQRPPRPIHPRRRAGASGKSRLEKQEASLQPDSSPRETANRSASGATAPDETDPRADSLSPADDGPQREIRPGPSPCGVSAPKPDFRKGGFASGHNVDPARITRGTHRSTTRTTVLETAKPQVLEFFIRGSKARRRQDPIHPISVSSSQER